MLRSLLEAGVSVFRLDLLCLSRESALKAVYALRSIPTELHRPVSLVLETQLSPGRAPDAPAISESDWADLRFGLECGVDWLAVSAGRQCAQREEMFAALNQVRVRRTGPQPEQVQR